MSALIKASPINSTVDAVIKTISDYKTATLSNTLAENAYNELSKMIQHRVLQGGQQIPRRIRLLRRELVKSGSLLRGL